MRLMLFKTFWGHAGSLADGIAEARAAGFDGVELPVPLREEDGDALLAALGDMPFIAEICTAGGYVPDRRADVRAHLDSLELGLARCAELKPLFVNCMAGCDAWPLERSLRFFGEALELGERYGQTLSFETHRGRSLFNPWITLELLGRLPQLKLTCDFSHWCVVAERLMDTEPEAIAAAARHAHHVHGRVGYAQGPQVPHPAAPEYAGELAAHQGWWEQIWTSQRQRGYERTTMTPEFGPDGYLHQLPFTAAPVADLWEINRWMGDTERQHFQRYLVPSP